MQLFGSLWWDGAQDCFMGLRGGFEKHCTRASLRSDTVEDLIRISVGGGGTRASLHSDTVEDLIRLSVGGGGGGTRASLHSDTVEDLIRIGVEGQVWKMLMLERVWSAGLAKDKDQES